MKCDDGVSGHGSTASDRFERHLHVIADAELLGVLLAGGRLHGGSIRLARELLGEWGGLAALPPSAGSSSSNRLSSSRSHSSRHRGSAVHCCCGSRRCCPTPGPSKAPPRPCPIRRTWRPSCGERRIWRSSSVRSCARRLASRRPRARIGRCRARLRDPAPDLPRSCPREGRGVRLKGVGAPGEGPESYNSRTEVEKRPWCTTAG
jgi:hypothetical protein